jgi:gluconate 5-dehydrogenase
VARAMIARGKGKIINIGSVQSELARPGIAPYTATKGAIRNLTKGMCTDWAKYGLQVNAIAPGYFRTEGTAPIVETELGRQISARTPLGRWGNTEEIGGAAVFLASDAASYVNGTVLTVDGGLTAAL